MAGPASPFPLPLRPELRDDEVLPRYLAQRRRRRRESEVLVANAVESLNALAACRGDGRLRPEAPSRIGPNGDAAACQESMLCNVGRAARDYLPMAKPDVEFPEGALAEVLRTKNVYDLDDDSPAAHYDPDKLKVLKGNTRPRDAKPLVGPEARRFLEFADELIALGDDELREASDPIQPHWDPTLARSIASKRAFIDSLRKVGLITFRRRARCHIGAFFVRKKHDQIRLVLDARPVNQLHRPAPKSRLATPGALANLNLSDEWAAISARALRATQGQVGFESGDAVGDFDVHTASVDLQDGYYQFEVAELSSWFSLGVTYTAMEAGVQEVWSDENRTMEPVDGSEHLWACFAGLPMGWSWALYFCHSACQSACERALARCGLPAVSLGDWTPAPFLATHSAVVAPYVDNANVVAGSKSVATKVLDAVKLELELLGLAVHDEMVPTQDMEMVGRRFDGKRRMLLPRWRRMWRLWFALSEVLRLRVLAPSQMRRLIGHLVDHFAARRETLCVLNAAYRFVGDGEGPVRPLDQEVLAELRVARGVLPLCGLRLDRPICPRVYCSDASDKGYALHVTTASPEEAWEAARFRERWRFRETEGEAVGRDRSLVLQGASAQAFACPGYDREFSLWAAARMEEEAQPAGRASPEPDGPASSLPTGRSRPIPRRDPDMVEVVGAVPRLAEAWVQPARWRRLVAGAWRRPGKIHCKEARAALLGLQREAADPASHGAVVLSFGDNLAETLAFDRGRAKDWELLALVRKGSAFQLGADLRWARRYIETKRNPSDADSRIADRGGLAPGQIIVGDAPPKLRRPLPLSAAVAPTWRRNDDEALAAGDLSVALKAPRDDSDAAEASLTTRRRRPRAALPAAPRPPPGRYVLELFAGCMAMSAGVASSGLRTAVPFELARGKIFNVCDARVKSLIVEWIRRGKIWALCLGTPCTRWTTANTTGRKGGSADAAGLQCAWATVELLRACAACGVVVVIENPWYSRLWSWPPLVRQLKRLGSRAHLVHMCAHGCAWLKPTCVHTNLPDSHLIEKRCPGHRRHVRLQGTIKHPTMGNKWRTHFASAYPAGMCRDVAQVLGRAAPPTAWRPEHEPVLHAYWQERLEAAAGGDQRARTVSLPAPRRRPILGWEGSTGFWDGLPLRVELDILAEIQHFNRARGAAQTQARPATPKARRRVRRVPAPLSSGGRHA